MAAYLPQNLRTGALFIIPSFTWKAYIRYRCRAETKNAFWIGPVDLSLVFPPGGGPEEKTAAITGNVADPTGASIVGATITAKDKDRETTYTVQTNRAGIFQIPRLPVGTYELTVGARGFQTAVYRSITLVLNQIARLDFQLKIGQATETIDVTSA